MGLLEKRYKEEKQDAYSFMRMSRVCPKCALLSDDLMMKCRHMCQWSPYFKSAEKEGQVKILYEAVGDLYAYQTELMSYVKHDTYAYFNRKLVAEATRFVTHDQLVNRNGFKFKVLEKDDIHVGIDPSGGGASYMACVCTSYMSEYKMFMVRTKKIYFIFIFILFLFYLSSRVCKSFVHSSSPLSKTSEHSSSSIP